MPDSIFHESMRQGITCVCVLLCVCVCMCVYVCVFVCVYVCVCVGVGVWVGCDTSCFPQDETDGISFITITSVDVGKS